MRDHRRLPKNTSSGMVRIRSAKSGYYEHTDEAICVGSCNRESSA